jgi:hypothetical protein
MAETLADELIAEIRKARLGEGLLNWKFTRNAIVRKLSDKINDLMLAIQQQRANIKRACDDSPDLVMYQNVLDKLEIEGKSAN